MGSLPPLNCSSSPGRVLRSRVVAGPVSLIELEVEGLSGGSRRPAPGQFYQIRCSGGPEHLLRRPVSVHSLSEWSDRRHVVNFLIEDVGWGTHKLCSIEPGGEVSVLGPLGNGFGLNWEGKSLLVAGGMGIAPLFFLAQEMKRSGMDYTLVCGFRSGESFDAGMIESIGAAAVCTEDGSAGTKGTACDLAGSKLADGSFNAVFTCGPDAMMAEVSGMAERLGVPCRVSLVSRMACGIGVCRGCVRRARDGGNLCVCREGPVFDSKMVEWD